MIKADVNTTVVIGGAMTVMAEYENITNEMAKAMIITGMPKDAVRERLLIAVNNAFKSNN